MAIANLPDDLVIEILKRLPVKSLIRFRCVCKSWFSLFANPSFITNHFNLNHHIHSPQTLIKRRTKRCKRNIVSLYPNQSLHKPGRILKLRFDLPENLQILGPINGIYCLCEDGNAFRGFTPSNYFLALWNPSTREFRDLPVSPLSLLLDEIQFVHVGFGLDPKTNDFKIVKIMQFKGAGVPVFGPRPPPPPRRAEVYSLSSDSWRLIDDTVPGFVCSGPLFTYANGFYHWPAINDEGKLCVVSFDMSDETFQTMPHPFPQGCSFFTALNGSLALIRMISIGEDLMGLLLDVWVMKEYGVFESWSREFSFGPFFRILSPLCIWNDDEVLLETQRGQLVFWSSSTREIKELEPRGTMGSLQALIYEESLVSVEGGNRL